MPDSQDNGYLTVFVTSAASSIPIEGALVRISGDGIEDVVRFTDKSGKTEKITLPSPPMANSEAPGQQNPFTSYRISVFKEGFYTQQTQNVPVFPSVSATQPINLIGLSEYNSDTVLPFESLLTVEENPQVLDRR